MFFFKRNKKPTRLEVDAPDGALVLYPTELEELREKEGKHFLFFITTDEDQTGYIVTSKPDNEEPGLLFPIQEEFEACSELFLAIPLPLSHSDSFVYKEASSYEEMTEAIEIAKNERKR
jgi:hypothetical protein